MAAAPTRIAASRAASRACNTRSRRFKADLHRRSLAPRRLWPCSCRIVRAAARKRGLRVEACPPRHGRSGAGKQPYAIAREDGQPIAFAGLWESFRWPDETVTRSFTILTTAPNAEMAELHDRMPVILERQDWSIWLGEAEGDHAVLLRPAADGLLRVWPVDRRVGSPRNPTPRTTLAPATCGCWVWCKARKHQADADLLKLSRRDGRAAGWRRAYWVGRPNRAKTYGKNREH
jgi:hypothetical protein